MNRPLPAWKLITFAMGLFAVQTFWGFTWATLPLYLKGIADSNVITGIMLSTTGITGMVLPVLSGSFSDRLRTPWGRRRPLIAAGWAVACAMLLLMPGIRSLGPALIVMIAAYAGFFTAIGPYFALLPDTVPLEQRSTATGVMFLVGGMGMLSYMMFAARLWDQSHLRPFLWAVAAIVLSSTVMCLSVKEQPCADAPASRHTLFGEAIRNRNVSRFFAGMILWWIGLWMVSAFFVLAYKDIFKVSTERAVGAFIIMNASFVFFALPAGLLAARLGLKRVTAVALAILAAALVPIPLLGRYGTTIPFLVITGAAYGTVLSVSYPFFLRLIPPGKTAGYVGIYMACQNGTLLLGPAIGGLMLDSFGYMALFTCAAGFVLAGLAIFITVQNPETVSPGPGA